jgi:hypothetical protein
MAVIDAVRLSGAGAAPGHHLVEHGTKTEDVSARVNRLAFRLFGGHVGHGSHDRALIGDGR